MQWSTTVSRGGVGIYIEDGNEMNNTIKNNVAACLGDEAHDGVMPKIFRTLVAGAKD